MLMRIFANFGLGKSEKEITSFLSSFSQMNVYDKGNLLGMAALLHHQIGTKDNEFERLLSSEKGENQGPIAMHILKLNRLTNELHREGSYDSAAAIKLWNITFRCMSHDKFHHYGEELWKIAPSGFPGAKRWIEEKLQHAEDMGYELDASSLRGALEVCRFIPPQFRDG